MSEGIPKTDIPQDNNSEPEVEVPCIKCGYIPYVWSVEGTELIKWLKENPPVPTPGSLRPQPKQMRFKAYAHIVHLLYGPLGKGHRVKLPPCVEDGIRNAWPEDEGSQYTGFKDVNN